MDKQYTIAEAASVLSLTDMSILLYIRYWKKLPTREDAQGNLYLLEEDLVQYRTKHQSQAFRRGRARRK